jgi:hypothetical protein
VKSAVATAALASALLSGGGQRKDSSSTVEALPAITTKSGTEMVLIPGVTFTSQPGGSWRSSRNIDTT